MQSDIDSNIKTAYDGFYENHDDAWRMLGARYKAQNIADVCKGREFKKILEVGAGDGSILFFLGKWNFAPEMHALELSKSGVEQIKSRNIAKLHSVQEFDGYHIPFGDDEFDLVILSHVLEHVEFERILLRELKRVSKYQVIEVPRDYKFGMDKKTKHFLNYGHINMYTPSSLRFLLKTEGLEILSDKISMIAPEVTKFNTFVNQKKKKSAFKSFKIDLEFGVKKLLSNIAGQKKKEEFANAYTVLTHKTSTLKIF
ncbi:methyltransferase domain-containing protein [Pedobacter sp. HMF7647]|uniref:Methyltransferase domain-containing protein n=1 Tax=Hufsiella arboris TaxID=2695275 RepID=A0A7K1YC88_9SPHI|nr:class I SAM-dependent methyltransferase [Hufsiella arboris]MXV51658.1 methyltransferase domain-containing protein [Hufsiella arboris]